MPGLLKGYTDLLAKYGDPFGLPRFAMDKLREAASPGPSPDVAAPWQFRTEQLNPARGQIASSLPDASARLDDPGIEPPAPPAPRDQMSEARAGFRADPSIDWASEREGFLAQGNADRMAAEAADAPRAAQSIFPWGRSVDDEARSSGALRGLQEARSMQDPGYRRQQRVEDSLADETAFVDPRAQAARGMRREEGLADKAGMNELMMLLQNDPRMLAAAQRAFSQKKELTQIEAAGRNPFGAMMGMGGNSPAPRGTGGQTVPIATVEAFAKREGISLEEAIQAAEADGFAVAR
jgi:hypothetical protein